MSELSALHRGQYELISKFSTSSLCYLPSILQCDVEDGPFIILITILQGKADKSISYSLETQVQK